MIDPAPPEVKGRAAHRGVGTHLHKLAPSDAQTATRNLLAEHHKRTLPKQRMRVTTTSLAFYPADCRTSHESLSLSIPHNLSILPNPGISLFAALESSIPRFFTTSSAFNVGEQTATSDRCNVAKHLRKTATEASELRGDYTLRYAGARWSD